jgi:hypothetical protein
VDAGDSFTGSVPETDLDGLPRLFDGTGNGAAEIDIGAFEFQANPVAHAGDNQTVLDSETVTLDGTLSFDPDGRTLTYRWTLDGAEIATAATANVGPFEVGTYTIALTVTDGDGDSTSHSVVLTVLPSNLPPVADAGPAQNVRVTQTATLDGTGTSDPEGGPLTYSWSLGEVEIATGAMPTVGPFAEGSHLITLTVTDEEGLTES